MINYEQFEKGFSGLFETKLSDIFPDDSTDTRCLSHALYMAMQQIRTYSERIVLHFNTDSLPEELLDYLAVEKNLPYYDGGFDIDTKRKLVREGMSWYFMAGTKRGVESLIQTIFGSGSIKEWFEFDEEEQVRGTFDVDIRGENITQDALEKFTRILRNAKNVSRHLRNVTENHDVILNAHVLSTLFVPDSIIIR